MRLLEPKTVRSRLLLVILVMSLPLAAVMGYIWWQSLQTGRDLALELLRTHILRIESNLRQLWYSSEWLLQNMAAHPDIRALQHIACKERMSLMRDMHPALAMVTLWTSDGSLVCSSIPPAPEQPSPQPHPATFARGIESDGLYMSDVFEGPITGQKLITFTHPVHNESGERIGLLSIPVRLDFFEKELNGLGLGEGYSAGIVDNNDTLVTRIPDNARWSGVRAPDDAVVRASRDNGDGVVPIEGIDGVRRTYVHHQIPELGWRVYVGIADNILYASFRKQLLFGILVFAIVISMSLAYAIFLSYRISRPLGRLMAVTEAVAAGDLTRRVDTDTNDDIGRVGVHVNTMLDTLDRYRVSLHTSNVQLHAVSDRLLRAEEAERERISRELHDQIGQELTALLLDLETLSRRNPAVQDPARRCITLVGRVLDQVRDITLALRPRQLDDLGLIPALRGHTERYIVPHGIKVHIDPDIDTTRLSHMLEATCFRIAQEALTNILRHARARNVWINLWLEESMLLLQISDDGTGFELETALARADSGDSSGLRNLFDRAQLAGGVLRIDTFPGRGTRIDVRIPLTEPPVVAAS